VICLHHILLFSLPLPQNTYLGIGVAPPAHPRSSFDPLVFLLVQVPQTRSSQTISVLRHQSETVHQYIIMTFDQTDMVEGLKPIIPNKKKKRKKKEKEINH
jgi:hypothetical protein